MIHAHQPRTETHRLAPVVPLFADHLNNPRPARNSPGAPLVAPVVPVPPGDGLGELADALLTHHQDWMRSLGRAASTVAERRYSVLRADRWLRVHRGRGTLEANRGDLTAWQLALPGGPYHRYRELSQIQQWYAWLYAEHYLDADPAAALRHPTKPRRIPRLPEDDVVHAALIGTTDPRILTALLLAAFCGLRIGEIAALHRDDVHDHATHPWLFVAGGKGDKDRRVKMPAELVTALRLVGLPARSYVIPRRDGRSGPLSNRALSKVVNRYLHRDVGTLRTIHGLRHWYATRRYEIDRDLVKLAGALGHASVATTQIYVTLADDPAEQDTVDKLGELIPTDLAPVHDLAARRRRRQRRQQPQQRDDTSRDDSRDAGRHDDPPASP